MAPSFKVKGVLAPVFTPFLESGTVDFSVIPIYMAHLNKHEVNGILGGTTGEGMSLSVEERKSLLEAWTTAARPYGTSVIAQVGGAPRPDVLELAKHAESLNVDGIMTLPELYYKPKDADELVSYLKMISNAAPTMPLVYYHFPMMTGVDINMRHLITEASSSIPNFKGIKADLGVADQVTDLLDEDQRVFIANHQIAPSVLMGHESSIATVSNMFPNLIHNIIEAVRSGEVALARVLQKRLNQLVLAISAQGDFVPSMKAAMELVTGIRVGPTRSPLTSLSNKQRDSLRDQLRNLDVQIKI